MAVTRLTTNGLTGTKYDIASADNYYMEPIATTLLSSAATDITFSNIPQGYKNIQIRGISRSVSDGGDTYNQVDVQINADTGSNYAHHQLFGDGASASAYGVASQVQMRFEAETGSAATASIFGAFIFDILDYSNVYKFKTTRLLGGYDANGSGRLALSSGLWMNTAAITSIKIKPRNGSFAINSRFSLYGIRG
jgi:hypothetical protein